MTIGFLVFDFFLSLAPSPVAASSESLSGSGVLADEHEPPSVGRPVEVLDPADSLRDLLGLSPGARQQPDLRFLVRVVAGGQEGEEAPVGAPARRRLALLARRQARGLLAVEARHPDVGARACPPSRRSNGPCRRPSARPARSAGPRWTGRARGRRARERGEACPRPPRAGRRRESRRRREFLRRRSVEAWAPLWAFGQSISDGVRRRRSTRPTAYRLPTLTPPAARGGRCTRRADPGSCVWAGPSAARTCPCRAPSTRAAERAARSAPR